MSLNSARIALFSHLNTNWTTTPIVFDGQQTGDAYVKRSDPWISTYITWSGEFQQSTPAPSIYVSKTGLLIITLFVRSDDGVAIVDQYTDSLFTIFRAKAIDNIKIYDLFIDKDEDDGVWQRRYLSISFSVRTSETISA